MKCDVLNSIHIMGKKWAVPILEEIALHDVDGFNRFLNKVDSLTPRILSLQLKEMEEEGLIKKESYKNKNRTMTRYLLTKKGEEMHDIVIDIKKWNMKWNSTPEICHQTSCTLCPGNGK